MSRRVVYRRFVCSICHLTSNFFSFNSFENQLCWIHHFFFRDTSFWWNWSENSSSGRYFGASLWFFEMQRKNPYFDLDELSMYETHFCCICIRITFAFFTPYSTWCTATAQTCVHSKQRGENISHIFIFVTCDSNRLFVHVNRTKSSGCRI